MALTVKVQKIRGDSRLPERASEGAVGFDVYTSRVLDRFTKEVVGDLPVEIKPGESVLIGIGIRLEVPLGYQTAIFARSGLASKYDIEFSNLPGIIDPDFRGEAGILIRNRSKTENFLVAKNMRLAQLIFTKAEIPVLEEAQNLSETKRGEKSFGSTGFFEINGKFPSPRNKFIIFFRKFGFLFKKEKTPT